MATDADILKDIRDKFKADTSAWREIREDGDKNMLVVSGDVWEAMDPAGKKARIEAKRPYLSFDELGQYTNQLVNEIRANKRAVKVGPSKSPRSATGPPKTPLISPPT